MSIKLIESILPGKNTPLGIAVSMGVDSVAAYLDLLSQGYNVFPIHYNHNLRPQNHEMQKQFVAFLKQLSIDLNIKIDGRTNVLEQNSFCDLSEAECREKRLNYFRDVCVVDKIEFIVTAHHLDDCVESYLLNCFRGKPDYQPIKLISDFVTYKILHPFLLTEKSDLQHHLEWCDRGKYKKFVVADETNSINKGSRRNWIRNVIVPELASQQISLKKFCRERIQQQVEKMFDTTD